MPALIWEHDCIPHPDPGARPASSPTSASDQQDLEGGQDSAISEEMETKFISEKQHEPPHSRTHGDTCSWTQELLVSVTCGLGSVADSSVNHTNEIMGKVFSHTSGQCDLPPKSCLVGHSNFENLGPQISKKAKKEDSEPPSLSPHTTHQVALLRLGLGDQTGSQHLLLTSSLKLSSRSGRGGDPHWAKNLGCVGVGRKWAWRFELCEFSICSWGGGNDNVFAPTERQASFPRFTPSDSPQPH